MSKRIAPYECNHRHMLFIQSSSRTGIDSDHGRERVEVCADCGTFFIWGDKNGVHFQVTFTLPTDELVAAAGVYAAGLREAEQEK